MALPLPAAEPFWLQRHHDRSSRRCAAQPWRTRTDRKSASCRGRAAAPPPQVLVEPRSSRLRLALIAVARSPAVAGWGKPRGCLLFPRHFRTRRHRLVAAGVVYLAAVAAAAPTGAAPGPPSSGPVSEFAANRSCWQQCANSCRGRERRRSCGHCLRACEDKKAAVPGMLRPERISALCPCRGFS